MLRQPSIRGHGIPVGAGAEGLGRRDQGGDGAGVGGKAAREMGANDIVGAPTENPEERPIEEETTPEHLRDGEDDGGVGWA